VFAEKIALSSNAGWGMKLRLWGSNYLQHHPFARGFTFLTRGKHNGKNQQ
jgi:hypothetical protein